MPRLFRLTLILSILLTATLTPLPAAAGSSGPLADCDPDGVQDSGAIYRICMPPDWWWNGDLVIFAHGYVNFNEPVGIPENQLVLGDGLSLPDAFNNLGYAFATTSYSVNGLAVKQGVADIVDLVDVFSQTYGQPDKVILGGASEGGLVTALAVEQHPDIFAGGLATCGPVGDFNFQTGYFGDFRVIFDTFFPGLIPGSPIDIPPALIDAWPDYLETTVLPTVLDPANDRQLRQLIGASNAPFDRLDMAATVELSVRDALRYSIYATNDAAAKLGGQPFDNQATRYQGSVDSAALNKFVQRFSADQAALDEIDAHYQTTGQLAVPLVTMHTTKDQQVPYRHEIIYRDKIEASGSADLHTNITIQRYGHCNFTTGEVLAALTILLQQIDGSGLDEEALARLLPDAAGQADYAALVAMYR